MKLRLKGNSLRLRLTQPEVTQMVATGRVEETVAFGTHALVYALERCDKTSDVSASFDGHEVTVRVARAVLDAWVTTDCVGFERTLEMAGGAFLRLLVEKDWQCLTARAGEDESSAFPNPNTGCSPTS